MKRQVPFVQYKKEPQLAASFRSMLTAISIAGALAGAALFLLVSVCPRFAVPYSFTLYDKRDALLGASVADDGQWRFPPPKTIPESYKIALILYEDSFFYLHPGFDPIAIGRAFFSNFRAGRIVSGGSTITMQTVRLSQQQAPRTLPQKIKEVFLSCILELMYSKESILYLYAAHAPYGGNVVGLEAASWRYFERSPEQLTWAEACTLAVLPNQPSLVRPGLQKEKLKAKRDMLLKRLYQRKYIDLQTYKLSLAEPVPEAPRPLPQAAPHYLQFIKQQQKNRTEKYSSGIDAHIQTTALAITSRHAEKLAEQGVANLAAIIIDNATGLPIAYIGNAARNPRQNADVDMIQARRSSGSLLKPFLFAGLLDAGMLLPDQLMIDLPTRVGSYIPQNNSNAYSGAVPASEALSMSLNIPFVRALQAYTIPAFLHLLKRCGFTTFDRTADEYGLPLILGGGELTLYQAVLAYRAMLLQSMHRQPDKQYPLSSGACRLAFEALIQGNRPGEEALWLSYASSQKIAWKTGTSFGNRDAWSIGVTPLFTVGVWAGNATGEGNPAIKSAAAAAPLMFELFSILPTSSWESKNPDDFERIQVCANSGYLAGIYCEKKTQMLKPKDAQSGTICPYCRAVSLTPDGAYQAIAADIPVLPKIENRFVLPAGIAYYYAKQHRTYAPLPPWLPKSAGNTAPEFDILFPQPAAQVFIPIEIEGSLGAMTAEAVHSDPNAIIYWDLDGTYLGKTQAYHQWNIQAPKGEHLLTLTDNRGRQIRRRFTVLPRHRTQP
ncbi:penicillin-binding protein 1C [Treponema phagedenis]|uniref:peptidoglycan glycosyltransferase n=1 Tax=Treponema phagedenis TaxID=162 RepID=A0A0B7H206_TREPH|nr:penicillin-binding protein 1C [Treponema phagedenis]QEK01093.1 penicillin-binding protein 1C [Treponema phagedenis]QEK04122.1 penicillin-binding protein 1C [Treponema phagedenis]QEK06101.1 penicillin-binding protein 1C [Treponema phagedenis]QSH95715.1 penicillin-binding protein 1C [Treponema phagedenis]QSH99461.1 penicillin-binding protein 1C [Treponema phagedenis]